MPISKVAFSLPPLNDANVSESGANITGGFSFSKGSPVMKISIPAQPRMLDTSEMFLTGNLVCCNADGSIMNALDFSAVNGASLSKEGNLNLSTWGGAQNFISKVSCTSRRSAVELMNVNNYPMYQNVRTANRHNDKDYLVSPLTRSMAVGGGKVAGYMNRHNVVSPDATGSSGGLMTNIINFRDENFGQPFSFKIDASLLNNGKPIHLGDQYFGGLVIQIQLLNDNGFFNRAWRDMDYTAQTNADVSGAFYRLKDVRLEGRYLIPTAQELAQYQPITPLSSRVNLINDVTASINVSSYTPQLASVKAVVNTFQDSDTQNNMEANQSSFPTPLGIIEYSQQKNNVRAPEDYLVEIKPNMMDTVPDNGPAAAAISAYQFPALSQGLSELRDRFQRSLFDGDRANKTSASLKLSNDNMVADYAVRAGATGGGNLNSAECLGVGCDFVHNIGETSNFVNQDYSVKIRSGVDSGSALLPVQRANKFELMESFVRHEAVINDATLVRSQ